MGICFLDILQFPPASVEHVFVIMSEGYHRLQRYGTMTVYWILGKLIGQVSPFIALQTFFQTVEDADVCHRLIDKQKVIFVIQCFCLVCCLDEVLFTELIVLARTLEESHQIVNHVIVGFSIGIQKIVL